MLNEKKIKLMTRLAKYEQGMGKNDIKVSKFYKVDYVRYNMLKTILSMTIGYVLILIMLLFYKSEYLIEKAVVLDYDKIGNSIVGIYIMLITVYICASIIWYSFSYETSKKKLVKYLKNLRELRKFYKEESEEKQGGK